MSELQPKRITVHDVARRAGVSLATVDRVLNRRPGVRARTIEKVEAAISELGFARDMSASLLARSRDISLHFILPGGANQFMTNLGLAVDDLSARLAPERIRITKSEVPPIDPQSLAQKLDDIDAATCDCAIIVGTAGAESRAAVERAEKRGLPVVTLVSDLPETGRRHFVGIDNRAAGRTAASLMGRFCGGKGRIGLVAGALTLADHRARYEGFAEVISAEFPHIELIGPVEGRDNAEKTESCTRELLKTHSDLAGIYSMGAGNAGLIAAITSAHRTGMHVIAHELTESTRDALKSGVLDVVIDQNPAGEIREAVSIARQIAVGGQNALSQIPIEIGIFLRDNLR